LTNTVQLPESFTEVETNLVSNLQKIMTELKYTPTSLAIKLSGMGSGIIISTEITQWLEGTVFPDTYWLFKLSKLLNTSVDSLLSSNFTAKVINKPILYSSGDEKLLLANLQISKENSMATKNTIVSVSKTSMKKMKETVTARTASKTYNVLLANKIYSSEMTLVEIAKHVGASTRSIRDYAFYGTSVPANIANNFVTLFHTSYHNLGLHYNADTDRYTHMTVTIKA